MTTISSNQLSVHKDLACSAGQSAWTVAPFLFDKVLASCTKLLVVVPAQARATWNEGCLFLQRKKTACHILAGQCRWSTCSLFLFMPVVDVVARTVRFPSLG